MIGAKVRTIIDRSAQLAARTEAAQSATVWVGVPSSNASRESGITNAAIASIVSVAGNGRPARPFLEPAIETNAERIAAPVKAFFDAPLTGHADPSKLFASIGFAARDAVRAFITAGGKGPYKLAPLAASTIKARKRIGFSGTKPLIRTGQLLNSIDYEVRKA